MNIYHHTHMPVVSPPMVIYMGEDKFESEFIVCKLSNIVRSQYVDYQFLTSPLHGFPVIDFLTIISFAHISAVKRTSNKYHERSGNTNCLLSSILLQWLVMILLATRLSTYFVTNLSAMGNTHLPAVYRRSTC